MYLQWRIDAIEETANRSERRLWELDSVRRDVDGLERSYGELRSDNDELRARVETLEDQVIRLIDTIDSMKQEQEVSEEPNV